MRQGQKIGPEQLNSYNRLYAMGMDSFTLSTQLNQLFSPAMGVDEGVFYLSAQQIARIPAWGSLKTVLQFKQVKEKRCL